MCVQRMLWQAKAPEIEQGDESDACMQMPQSGSLHSTRRTTTSDKNLLSRDPALCQAVRKGVASSTHSSASRN